jgi:hypothetical protein
MANIGNKRSKHLHDNINLFNRRLTQEVKSDKYDYVPVGLTYDDVIERIHSVKDYNAVMRFLNSNDPKQNKGALDVVFFQGKRVPRYVVDLMHELGEGINDRRLSDAEVLYEGFNSLSPVEKAARLANVGLNPITIENYGADKLNVMFNERFPNVKEKAEIYIQVWEDWGGDPEIPKIIRKIAEEEPDRFVRIMDSNDMEKEIHFIYPSNELTTTKKNKRGWVYNVQAADQSAMGNRYEQAVNYWKEIEAGRRY